MPLILRIDVDKPYGNHTLFRKISSKFFEETGLSCPSIGYLDHLKNFLSLLKSSQVQAIFYFRICTIPDKKLVEQMLNDGHKIGWHLENSKDFRTFSRELDEFKKRTGLVPHSFTKHGSGEKKLGRHHYPKYEPEKYKMWAKESGIPFYFGNGQITKDSKENEGFYSDPFWIERNYRTKDLNTIEDMFKKAEEETICIITHPENVIRDANCKNDLIKIIQLARSKNVSWSID